MLHSHLGNRGLVPRGVEGKGMTQRFKIGSEVRLNESGRENECYAKFRDKVLRVQSVATNYMPASEFYAKGKPRGFHPGYDDSTGCALYDCHGINCSLYDWELESA
jgi:hypothetical protein